MSVYKTMESAPRNGKEVIVAWGSTDNIHYSKVVWREDASFGYEHGEKPGWQVYIPEDEWFAFAIEEEMCIGWTEIPKFDL